MKRNDITHQELAANKYTQLVPANSEQQIINLLNMGRVDFLRTPIYFALSKNTNKIVIEALNSGLSKVRWVHE